MMVIGYWLLVPLPSRVSPLSGDTVTNNLAEFVKNLLRCAIHGDVGLSHYAGDDCFGCRRALVFQEPVKDFAAGGITELAVRAAQTWEHPHQLVAGFIALAELPLTCDFFRAGLGLALVAKAAAIWLHRHQVRTRFGLAVSTLVGLE